MAVCGTGISSISSVDGISGVILPPTQVIVEKLAEQIEFSHLAQSLRDRISVITDLENGLTQVNSLVTTETGILAQELLALKNELTGAVAYINDQTTIDIGRRQALVETVNTLLASMGGKVAALEEKSTVQANINGSLLAEKTVKIDLAGNVSGYGLSSYADPDGNATSDFQVRADTFSIAPPAVHGPNPPENPYHGMVWVDTSLGVNETRWYNSENSQWSILPVKGVVPFVVKTSPETVDGVTVQPGVYIDSAYITQLKADQIDTRNLTVRAADGTILLGAGTDLDWSKITGDGKPQSGATRNVYCGDWASNVSYVVGDIVYSGGSSWNCLVAHTSTTTKAPPTLPTSSNTWWGLVASQGDKGNPGAKGDPGNPGAKGDPGVGLNSSNILSVATSGTVYVPGIRAGTLAWNTDGSYESGKGIAITPNGFYGHNGSQATFEIDATTGKATFAGELSAATGSFAGSLSAATGTFSGTLTANAIDAVNTINIADQAVTIPKSYNLASNITSPSSPGTETEVFNFSIDSEGQPIWIHLHGTTKIGSTFSGGSNSGSTYNYWTLTKLYIDGAFATSSTAGQLTLTYLVPAGGNQNKSIKVTIKGQTTGFGGTTSAGEGIMYAGATIFAIGTKR